MGNKLTGRFLKGQEKRSQKLFKSQLIRVVFVVALMAVIGVFQAKVKGNCVGFRPL